MIASVVHTVATGDRCPFGGCQRSGGQYDGDEPHGVSDDRVVQIGTEGG